MMSTQSQHQSALDPKFWSYALKKVYRPAMESIKMCSIATQAGISFPEELIPQGKTFTECLARMRSFQPLSVEALANALRLFLEQHSRTGSVEIDLFVSVFDQNICCETCLNSALLLGEKQKLFSLVKRGCPVSTRKVINSNGNIIRKPMQSIVAVQDVLLSEKTRSIRRV